MKSRNADYKLLKVFEKFEQVSESLADNTSGNISDILYKVEYTDDYKKVGQSYYEMVNTPMFLARLVSAGYTPKVEGQSGYKITWRITLRHKKTKAIATFYDYKGYSSFGCNDIGYKSKAFIKDLKKLTLALANNRFPHPYDGCVVGEIA